MSFDDYVRKMRAERSMQEAAKEKVASESSFDDYVNQRRRETYQAQEDERLASSFGGWSNKVSNYFTNWDNDYNKRTQTYQDPASLSAYKTDNARIRSDYADQADKYVDYFNRNRDSYENVDDTLRWLAGVKNGLAEQGNMLDQLGNNASAEEPEKQLYDPLTKWKKNVNSDFLNSNLSSANVGVAVGQMQKKQSAEALNRITNEAKNSADFAENSDFRYGDSINNTGVDWNGENKITSNPWGNQYSDTFTALKYMNGQRDKSSAIVTPFSSFDFSKEAKELTYSQMSFATDEERAIANYLANKNDPETLKEYFDALIPILNERSTQNTKDLLEKDLEEHPVESRIGQSILSVPLGVTRGISYAKAGIDMLSGKGIDPNDPWMGFTNLPTEMRESVSKAIEENVAKNNGSEFAQGAHSWGYQTLMSMADFLFTALVSGGFGSASAGAASAKASEALTLGIMGSGAAASTVVEAKEKGYSDEDAFTLATIIGMAEIFTEKVSLETLLNPELINDGALKYIAKNFIAEGSEEVASDLIGDFASIALLQSESDWYRAIDAYKAKGHDEPEAVALAFRDKLFDLGSTALAGALSGGVMAGGGVTINSANQYRIGRNIRMNDAALSDLIDAAASYGEDTKSGRLAKEIQQSGIASNRKIGELEQSLEFDAERALAARLKQLAEEKIEEATQTAVERIEADSKQAVIEPVKETEKAETKQAEKTAKEILDTIPESQKQAVKSTRELIESTIKSGEAEQVMIDTFDEMLADRVSTTGSVPANLDLGNYVEEYFNYYEAGKNGADITTVEDNGSLSALEKEASYLSGKMDSQIKAESADVNKTEKALKDTLNRIKGENYGTNVVSQGSNRSYLQNTGKQGKGVAEGTRQASQAGRERFNAKDVEIKSFKRTGKEVTAKSLGIDGGTDTTKVRLWEEGYSESMKKAKQILDKHGIKTVFFHGGNLSTDGGDVRGCYDPDTNTAYIRVDHEDFDAYNIARHETLHKILTNQDVETRARNVETLYEELVMDLQEHGVPDEMIDRVLNLYLLSYTGYSEAYAKEELLCDFYGDMNVFNDPDIQRALDSAGKFREIVDEVAPVIEGRGGETKYSLDLVKPIEPKSKDWERGSTTEEVKEIYPKLWNVAAKKSKKRNPTQITSTVATYRKIYDKLKADGFEGSILDASSGLGYGTKAGIEEYGFNVDDIEPYPDEDYKPKFTDYSKLHKKYDVIISNAVLNVLPQEQRDALVVKMGQMLNPGGKLFVNVRSLNEIKSLQNKIDAKTGQLKNIKISSSEAVETSKGSYQKGFTKNELVSYLQDALGYGYDVKPVSWFGGVSAEITKSANNDVRFSRETAPVFYSQLEREIERDLQKDGVDVVDGSAVRFSRDTWDTTDKKKVLNNLVAAGFTKEESKKWINDVNSISAIIGSDLEKLDYVAADNQVMLKNNDEYYKTLDASTLCAKRLLYQGTFNRITELLPNTILLDNDLIQIRKVMAELNDVVPCGICYVESRRKTLSKFAGQWLNEVYKGDVKVDMHDLTSTDGLEALRMNHPEVYDAYTAWMRARGTANPKVVELRTAYRGEILKLRKTQIANIKRIGGLRVQSFSDFESVHLIDMMQAVLDMSAKGLTSQAYTKVPNFAWAFGDTGIKINLSLIGKAVNGVLVFDAKEGMDINDAMKLRDRYSDNVGTILVGANKESILLAMADDRIDFIIPFHRSGWSKKQFDALGLKGYEDFQKYQNERKLNGKSLPKKVGNLYPIDYWDYSKTGKENAERYLEICKEQKRIPKFENFLVNNGDGSWSLQPDGSTDGYWKLLIDFKMYNNAGIGAPQRVVIPNFNMEECQRILNEYDGTGNRSLPVDEEAAQKFVKEYKKNHKGVRFSSEADNKDRGRKALRNDDSIADANIQNGRSAVDQMIHMAENGVDPAQNVIRNAMYRSDLGSIDFVWGEPGTGEKFKHGYGLSHIIAKRNAETGNGEDVAFSIVDAIAKAPVYDEQHSNQVSDDYYRVRLFYNDTTVVLSKEPDKNSWLLTGWDNAKTATSANGEVHDSSIATAVTPTRTRRNGDATVSNSTVAQNGVSVKSQSSNLLDIREQMDHLEKAPSAQSFSSASMKKWVRSLTKEFGQKVNVETIEAALKNAGEIYFKERNTLAPEELEGKIREALLPASGEIVKNAEVAVEDGNEANYRSLRQTLKHGINLSDQDKADIPDYNEWRKSNMGYVTVSKNGQPMDTLWAELQEEFGKGLFPDEITHPADQIRYAVEVLKDMDAIYENPFQGYEMAAALEDVTNSLLGSLYNGILKQSEPTFAERMEARLQEERAGLQKKIDQAVAENQKQNDRLIALLKREYEQNIKLAVRAQKLQDMAEKKRTISNDKLLRMIRRLKNKKLSPVNRARVDEYIKDLDAYSVGLGIGKLEELTALKRFIEENSDIPFPERLKKEVDRLELKHLSDLTDDERADLAKVLLAIETEINNAQKQIDAQDKRETFRQSVSSMGNISKTKGTKAGLPRGLDDFFVMKNLAPGRYFNRITGYIDNDPMRLAGLDLEEGTKKSQDHMMRAYKMFDKWLEDRKLMRQWQGRFAKEIDITGKRADGGKVTLKITPAMLMSLYMHSLNNDNMRHIMYGGIVIPDMRLYKAGDIASAYSEGKKNTVSLTRDDIKKATSALTETERAFINAVQSYYGGMSQDGINEVSIKLNGYELATVTDYFPIYTDEAFVKTDFSGMEHDGTIEGMGSLQERVTSTIPIYLNDITSVVSRSIGDTARYVGLAIPVRNMNKLLKVTDGTFIDIVPRVKKGEGRPEETFYVPNDSILEEIDKQWGKPAVDYLKKLMRDIQSGSNMSGVYDLLFKTVKNNYVASTLVMNASVSVKQFVSYFAAVSELGWKPVAKALKYFGRRIDSASTIDKYTPVQWQRSRGFSSPDIGNLTASGIKLPPILNWIQAVDIGTTRLLWKACEYYVDDNFKDLERGTNDYSMTVSEVYNRVIWDTQPNYDVMHRPENLRSDNPLVQSFMMFKTQPVQNFNIVYDAVANLKAKETQNLAALQGGTEEEKSTAAQALKRAKKRLFNALTSQIFSLVFFAGLTAAWNALRGKTDKYKDKEGEATFFSIISGIGRDVIGGAAGAIPVGTEIWDIISSWIYKDRYYGYSSVTESAISDIAETVQSTGSAILEGKMTPAKWKKLVKNTAQLFGIPLKNVANLFNMILRLFGAEEIF